MMTSWDWLDLLALERRLPSQGWIVASGLPYIRNRRGQCPLCAWAELQGARQHSSAWPLALRDIFGMDEPFGDAHRIADAADKSLVHLSQMDMTEEFFLRAALLHMLNLKEPS